MRRKTKIKNLPFLTRIIKIDGKRTHYLTRNGYMYPLNLKDKTQEEERRLLLSDKERMLEDLHEEAIDNSYRGYLDE